MPFPLSGKPRVIQGSFLGGAPKLSPAVTLQPSTGASPRPMAPHVQAAAARHVQGAPVAQRFPGPPPASAPPARAGHAIALPPAFQLSPERPGQPLPPDLRQQMEGLLNADFSAVRIHVGSQAARLGAHAMTMGSEIYFAPGQYSPGTSHGRRLLAHELTHVVQQSTGRVRNPFGQGIAVVHDPGLEAEAERISLRAASAGPGTVLSLCPSPAQPHRPVTAPVTAVQMAKRTGTASQKTTVKGKITKPPRTKTNTPRPKRTWEVSKKVTVEGATGHSGSGYLLQGTKLKGRRRRNYKESRIEQVLGEVSTLLYFALKDGDESVTEVEAMMAGGSLFLACNARSETQALYEFLVLKSKKDRVEALTSGYGTGKVLKATNRMATKVHMLRSGQRNFEKAKTVIEALENGEVGWIDLEGDEPDFYAGLALEVSGFTWVIFGQDKRHAEVKLVKVLEAAGYKGAAVVQGKKRPCYTCAAYMRLRKQEGYSLVFSDFPGKLWQDEFNRSEGDVQEEVIRSLKTEVPSHKTDYGEEWRSDSESEDDDLPKRPVRAKKKVRRKTTKK